MEARLIKTRFGFILNGLDDIYISSVATGKLSIHNCEEIEIGYNLDEIAEEYARKNCEDLYEKIGITGAEWGWETASDFKFGFKKAVEIMGDKRFTESDMEAACAFGMALERLKNDPHKLSNDNEWKGFINTIKKTEWLVDVLWETDKPTPFKERVVVRKLDNGDEVEWTCFWDNGWFDKSGCSIPNVIEWKKLPILDEEGFMILKRI